MSLSLRRTAIAVAGLALALGTGGAAFASATTVPASGHTTAVAPTGAKSPSAICISKTPDGGIAVTICAPPASGIGHPTSPNGLSK